MSGTEIPQPALTPQSGPPAPPTAKSSNGLATAGFVLGVLGFLGAWIPLLNFLAILLGIIGAILAAVGLSKVRTAGSGKGLAISGLALSVLAVVISIAINVAFVGAVDDAVDDAKSTTVEAPKTPAGDASGAATAEPAEDKELGKTRANPAPIGSAITGGNWTVTVNSVKTAKQDKYGRAPDAGQILLVINLTATYNGDDEQGDSAWARVKFVAADGTTIDSTDGLFIAENGFDSLKTVYSGASVTGDEMLAVPENGWQKGVLAVSPGAFKDDTFIAVR